MPYSLTVAVRGALHEVGRSFLPLHLRNKSLIMVEALVISTSMKRA